MNEQDNQQPDNQQSMIEDLTVEEAEEVKGGPIEIREIPIRVRL